MREAIGKGNYQARGDFAKLTSKPHFYGLAAVAGLKGEATIVDSKLVATEVSCCGSMVPIEEEASEQLQGTYLLGTYVDAWSQEPIRKALESSAFESQIRKRKADESWASAPAFPFLLEGELSNAKVHVINGACPMHARLQELKIPEDKKPYEKNYARLQCKVLGFFADNSVGLRTHPGTSIHAHVIFKDPDTGQEVTAHLERFTVEAQTTLSLPR